MSMTLGDAAGMALSFVLFVVVVGIGATTLASIQTAQTVNSTAYNSTGFGLTGLNNLANQSGTIGTIIGASVIIGILVGAFYLTKSQ